MKRLFGGSCSGLLMLILLGGMAALFAFTIFFQQSQAVSSNVARTLEARTTATETPRTPKPIPTQPSVPMIISPTESDVTIQVEPEATETVLPNSSLPTLALGSQQTATSTPTQQLTTTPTYEPRYSGTSSYPLTVTAEVMFAQTNVANYQADIAATRTMIAAESEIIYATLTAGAPTQLGGMP